MKAFTLHDGEDEDKTSELNELMATKGLDWEGDNHGITVWHAIPEGDTMLFGPDGSFRILSKKLPVTITKYAFRHVYAAMLLVERDNGAHHLNNIRPGTIELSIFTMPYSYGVERLVEAERALEFLSEHSTDEFEDLVVGEVSDQEAVVRKHAANWPGMQVAHDLINDWFNGWERPFKWEAPTLESE